MRVERGLDALALEGFGGAPDSVGEPVEPTTLGAGADCRFLQADRIERGHADGDEHMRLPQGSLLPTGLARALDRLQ